MEIKFDDNQAIKHPISSRESSLSTVFVDTIQLNKYGNIFQGKRLEIIFEFNNKQLLLLTEITFDNQPAILLNTTLGINNTTNCPIGNTKNKEQEKIIFIFSNE